MKEGGRQRQETTSLRPHRPSPRRQDLARARALFERVLEVDVEERDAFLDAECGGDEGLREQLASLLRRDLGSEGCLRYQLDDSNRQGPLPETIGPYRIVRRLGRGGMGVVYDARHRETGQAAALKTVRVTVGGTLEAIRREIRGLARLQHPGIVRFVDTGVEEGTPWYAMELLRGALLRDAIQSRDYSWEPAQSTGPQWWTGALYQTTAVGAKVPPQGEPAAAPTLAENLPRLLTFVRRLCDPLAYMHGEGLVHRDLKPENILVRPGGMPVIVDFGLMRQFGGRVSREVFEILGVGAGTWGYMPPEQARGEQLDARADLYSLGCILYELLTGQPPFGFQGDNILDDHATKPPPSLDGVDGIPPELNDLVLSLLEKEPRNRRGHADDVAATLARLGAENGTGEGSHRPYLYQPGFAGRDEMVSRLKRPLRRLTEGEGGISLIGGESGVGKTRLSMEVARYARENGASVLVGECDEARRGALRSFNRPLQAIADHCAGTGARETQRIFGPRVRVLATVQPALAHLPGYESIPEPEILDAEGSELRLYSYLLQTLREMASVQPLLIVLDDLQWADELTVGFLEFLARTGQLEASAVRFLGIYRTEETTEGLTKLRSRDEVDDVVLGRLDEGAVGAMVKEMLALPQPPTVFTRFLLERSEGVPFFVAEYLRVAIAEGVLYRDAAGVWRVGDGEGEATHETYESLPLPSSLADLVGRRLDGLRPSQRALVDMAAVLGREVSVQLLGEATADGADWDHLEALRVRQVFELEGEVVRFSHDRIREVAYAQIPEGGRRERHELAARAIEAVYSTDLDPHQAELGRHWATAGDRLKGRRCYLAGARRAASAFTNEEAERLYRSYLALVDQPTAESLEARNELASKVLVLTGRSDQARPLFVQSVEEARALGNRLMETRSLVALGRLDEKAGRIEPSREALEDALRLSRDLSDRAEEGTVLECLGHWHRGQGRMDAARAIYEESLAISREVKDRMSEGTLLGNLANLSRDQGRGDEARTLYQQALDIHRETGYRREEAKCLDGLAILLWREGQTAEAGKLHQQTLAFFREVGDRRAEAYALGSLGLLHKSEGRLELAQEMYEQSRVLLSEVGDRRAEGFLLNNLAGLSRTLGRKEAAREQYEQALQIFRGSGYREGEGVSLANLGSVHLGLGNLDESEKFLEQALAVHRGVGNRMSEGITFEHLGNLFRTQMRMDEANETYEQALAIHREVGNRSSEGTTLRKLSKLALIADDLPRASALARRAEEILQELGEKFQLALVVAQQGHIRLAGASDASEALAWVRSTAQELEVEPNDRASQLAIDLAKLQRAQRVFEAGGPLLCGYCPEDMTDRQMTWLREHRPESIPPGR